MRNTEDFRLFADLRLSGVGMVGVMHATKPIDSIQRFIGRIELGVIPHIVDTVIFIMDGQISSVFSLEMEVKVPSGMFEQDLARPVVVVHDFNTGRLEFEIYSYGKETVVIPVSAETKAPTHALAAGPIKQEFLKYTNNVEVEVVSNNKCIVYVPEKDRSAIIGKQGSNIENIEKKLGLNIDVRDLKPGQGQSTEKERGDGENINFPVKIHKSNITFMLSNEYSNMDIDIFVEGDYALTAHSSKKAVIKLSMKNKIGKVIRNAVKYKEKIELKA